MVAYGRRKRVAKLHPNDWCGRFGEYIHVSKSHERFLAREEAISAAEEDMMFFGTGVVLVTSDGVKHVPLKDLEVVIPPVGT